MRKITTMLQVTLADSMDGWVSAERGALPALCDEPAASSAGPAVHSRVARESRHRSQIYVL